METHESIRSIANGPKIIDWSIDCCRSFLHSTIRFIQGRQDRRTVLNRNRFSLFCHFRRPTILLLWLTVGRQFIHNHCGEWKPLKLCFDIGRSVVCIFVCSVRPMWIVCEPICHRIRWDKNELHRNHNRKCIVLSEHWTVMILSRLTVHQWNRICIRAIAARPRERQGERERDLNGS